MQRQAVYNRIKVKVKSFGGDICTQRLHNHIWGGGCRSSVFWQTKLNKLPGFHLHLYVCSEVRCFKLHRWIHFGLFLQSYRLILTAVISTLSPLIICFSLSLIQKQVWVYNNMGLTFLIIIFCLVGWLVGCLFIYKIKSNAHLKKETFFTQ